MNKKNSKLVLGTVELGLPYGLNNIKGQPSLKESFSILDNALTFGIDTFDTAFAYGAAEDVLGKWIKSRNLNNKIKIISKLKPYALNDYPDGVKASDIIRLEINKSLQRLNIDQLDGYLLHTPQYVYNIHIINGLKKAKSDGLIKKFGVSIYDEAEALYAANMPVDYIQIPYNIFDQRLNHAGFFNLAKKNNITVFARSPFLQGLLLMPSKKVPPHLNRAKPLLNEFISYLNRCHLSPLAATLAFTLKNPNLDFIVFGANTPAEIKEVLFVATNLPPLPNDFFFFMEEKFSQTEKAIVNPSLWKTPLKKSRP
ncbi:MAG: aldo/keto reductase [Candidatus Paceibacterota bacterium]